MPMICLDSSGDNFLERLMLKITSVHYVQLKLAIGNVLFLQDTAPAAYAAAGLSPMRLRWDCLRAATIEGKRGITWICDTLYSYLNDEHIDSALRAIFHTMNLPV